MASIIVYMYNSQIHGIYRSIYTRYSDTIIVDQFGKQELTSQVNIGKSLRFTEDQLNIKILIQDIKPQNMWENQIICPHILRETESRLPVG